MSQREFVAWPKIARLEGETMTITEKLDGTNACVVITEFGSPDAPYKVEGNWYDIYCQSRNRIITPDDDNFGFAAWVHENYHDLVTDLGLGRHYGEWWGLGIQRNYGLEEKRFSLFNVHKYADREFVTPNLHVVPVLYDGPFYVAHAFHENEELRKNGSVAALGFDNPEGVVVYLEKARTSYKITDAVRGQKHG